MPHEHLGTAILTLKEVSEYLKVTERTIYRLAAGKKMPAFKSAGLGDSRRRTSINGSRVSLKAQRLLTERQI